MDQRYPCTSVSSVEMAQSWLLGVCISNWLCTIPLTPPPLSLPTSILCLCVCMWVSAVPLCGCAQSRPFANVYDYVPFSVCLKEPLPSHLPIFPSKMWSCTQFSKIINVYCLKESLSKIIFLWSLDSICYKNPTRSCFLLVVGRWPFTVIGCVLLLHHRTLPHLCPLFWLSTLFRRLVPQPTTLSVTFTAWTLTLKGLPSRCLIHKLLGKIMQCQAAVNEVRPDHPDLWCNQFNLEQTDINSLLGALRCSLVLSQVNTWTWYPDHVCQTCVNTSIYLSPCQ